MSTTIDQRVVEMRFDNKQFERGVSETMSTLEKLKQKLNFKGAVKGAESINSAAKGMNVSMSGLGGSVEQVSLKFSALQVMGVTALSRLTNSAITAGTRIARALTIDPVTTGFQEYETQINAVQTILANTSHAGTTIEDVNKALDDLNKYADQTIYNFTEMTRNIGTFTAAGVDLNTSTSAIKGIANLAAVSGSTSQQASTAMYQLSQALAAGRVSLMDWNSVVNAGMGGKVFQDALIRTSEAMGTGADKAIEKYGSFRESLTQGEWLTTEVLTETLEQFTMAAEEGSDEWNKFKETLKEKGYTEEQAVEILKMANTATDAATKVKTFTQLWDVLKESAQSGWSQSWKLIIGDFEEAKNLLTPISETLTGLINKTSDFRNAILKSALGRTFADLNDRFATILKPAAKAMEVAKGTADAISDLGTVVDEVILGKFGNGKDRIDSLTEAGINYYKVQNEVNKKLGNGKRYTQEQIEAQDKLLGTQTKSTEKVEEQGEATVKLTNAQKNQLIWMSRMTDAELKQEGYTQDQIDALRELQKTAEDLGIPFDKFINQLDEINGRWLLINSFKNVGKSLADVGKAIGAAWKDVFPEHSVEYFADKLFNILGTFHKITAAMTDVFWVRVGTHGKTGEAIYELTEAGEKLVSTFKGIFAAVDIVSTVIGGGFKIAFKIASELFSRFGLSILDVTAIVGDAIVNFRDWLDSILNVSGIVDFLIPILKTAYNVIADIFRAIKNSKWFNDFCNYLSTAAEGIGNLFRNIPNMTAFQNLINVLRKAGNAIKDWIQTLKESNNIPGDIIAGLVKGITGGIPEILAAVFELAKSIIEGICQVLGIQSPATTMIVIGGFIIAGLIKGMADGETDLLSLVEGFAGDIWETMKAGYTWLKDNLSGLFKSLWDFLTDENGKIDFGKIFAGGALASLLWVLIQFTKAVNGITDGIGGIGDILENAGDCLKKFGNVLSAYSWDLKATALLKLVASIAILAACVIALSQVSDIGKLWNAVGVIAVLAVIVGLLLIAMDKFTSASAGITKDGVKIEGLQTALLQIALAVLALGYVVKMIGDMDPTKAKQGMKALSYIAAGMVVVMIFFGAISKYAPEVDKVGNLALKLGMAMALMIFVFKLVDGLTDEQIGKGILFASAFAIFVIAIARVANGAGEHVSKVGGMAIKLAIAMGLMIGVMKLAASLTAEEMIKGALFAAGFVILIESLVMATTIGKEQQIAKLGGLIMSVSASMMLMVGVCKLVGMLSVGEMLKGAAFALGFTILVKVMVGILSVGSETTMAKVSGTIFAMAFAIGILAAIAVAIGYVDTASLVKGITAVSILCGMMALMVHGLKGAKNAKGAIMMMAIAIAVMAAAVVALTFIDSDKLAAAAASLSVVMGMFALIEKNAGRAKKSVGVIAVMTVVIGAIALILWLLANNLNDANAAIGAAIAVGILMGAMAVSLKMLSGLKPITTTAIGAMAGLAIILYGLAGVFAMLKALEVQPSLEAAMSLSVLLLAMSGVTAILATIGPAAAEVLPGLGALGLVVMGVMILLTVLAGLNEISPDLQEWLDTGIVILEKIGQAIGKFVGGLIGGVGEGMMNSLSNMVDTFGEIVEKLVDISEVGTGIKLEGFTGIQRMLEILGSVALTSIGTGFADLISGWIFDQTTLEKFETDGVALMNAMQKISDASAGVTVDEDAMDDVINVAERLAKLQKSIDPIGGLIKWFTGRDDLATFGVNAGLFLEAMKIALGHLDGFKPNTEGLDVVITATEKLAELQKSLDPIGGIISWFTGRDDLGTFGVNAGLFMESMKIALGHLDGFSPNTEGLDVIISAAESLTGLQKTLEPIGGVITWFTGRDDLGTFGNNVAAFIGSMKLAFDALDGSTLDETALQSVIAAAEDLSTLQSKLEPIGGVITWFTGREDLGTFGEKVKTFAEAMGTLKTEMGESGITEDVVASVTNAGTAIIELQKALPTEGWFDGKMNLTDFANYIKDFGDAMGTFGETAGSIDGTAVNTAITSAQRIRALIESLVGLDTSGVAAFTGVGTGGVGADGAAHDIAQAVADYGTTIAGVDVSAVATSVTSVAKIKEIIAGLVGLDTSGVANFKPEEVGTALKAYADSVSGIDLSSVTKSISTASRLRSFISSLAGIDTSGVGSFTQAISELSTVEVESIVTAFSSAADKMPATGAKLVNGLAEGIRSNVRKVREAIGDVLQIVSNNIADKLELFEKVGKKIIDKLSSGISKNKKDVKTAVQSCVNAAAMSIATSYTSFYNSGSYLVEGFANGISANTYKATAKAKAMADAAEKAAREALGINSPSRVFKEIGGGVPEGFALGIRKMTNLIDAPLNSMSGVAMKSVSDTVSRIATAIDSDMDVQPTIRPVLDLSNVRAGSGAISSMLGTGSSVGVLAKVGAINNAMNRRSQNVSNADVVSAIDRLDKHLDNVGNTTYSINGITYDDGSNVAAAIKDLTRYARMERRT